MPILGPNSKRQAWGGKRPGCYLEGGHGGGGAGQPGLGLVDAGGQGGGQLTPLLGRPAGQPLPQELTQRIRCGPRSQPPVKQRHSRTRVGLLPCGVAEETVLPTQDIKTENRTTSDLLQSAFILLKPPMLQDTLMRHLYQASNVKCPSSHGTTGHARQWVDIHREGHL